MELLLYVMFIDLVFLILLVVALFKGISRGFIVAVFSMLAFIIGLAAALKLSATVAAYLHSKMNIGGYWLPFLSFIIVFASAVFVIQWAAVLLKKASHFVFLGWLDTLFGFLLYAFMYTMAYSVILFFATRLHLISEDTKAISKTYAYIEPLGPKVMNWLGKAIPFFSHMFSNLSRFFEGASKKV